MDELKLKLSTRFMRGFVARLVSKAIYKKFGYDVDILINEIEIRTEDGKIHLHTSVEAEMKYDDFRSAIKDIGLDD